MNAPSQRGKILNHGHGLGAADRDKLEERAREIAVIRGRLPEQVTEADRRQARLELFGVASDFNFPEEEIAEKLGSDLGEPGTKAPTRRPADEQTYAEQLVEEGVDEAAREQMIEGNLSRRRKDQA